MPAAMPTEIVSLVSATYPVDPVSPSREDLRAIWPLLLPLLVAAGGLVAVSAPELSSWSPSGHGALVLITLCVAATALERFAVELPDGDEIHLSPVVVLYAAVVYGVVPAVAVALVSTLTTQITLRKPGVKLIFNVSQSVLGAGLAAWVAVFTARHANALPLIVAAAVVTLVAVNVGLVSLARARCAAAAWRFEARRSMANAWTTCALIGAILPFLIIGVRASPWYGVLAVGPLLAIRSQLSARARASRARHEALTDALTGLGNRRLFDERLGSEVERADRRDLPLAVCLIDLDGFKAINDRFGHLVGDQALIAVASTLRKGGEAFRYGGDEFALMLPEHDEADAAVISEAVRSRVHALEVDGVSLSISHGIAVYRPSGSLPANEIVRVADENLYRSKRRC
jgi:diguanylate cyclase (GGDEF)-like protein